jgi:LmbE family N-acetylglucosaminyl deacetylase
MKRFIDAWLERRSDRAASLEVPLVALPAAFPLADARRVLVFAPHPDDESIGCGGLLTLLARAGVPTRVVLVSDGAGAGGLPPGAGEVRQQEFRAALSRLGVTDFAQLGFPDGELTLGPALEAAISHEVQAFSAPWIFVPASIDLHRDHRVVTEAARRAAMQSAAVAALWHYETWSPLQVSHVLDISEVLESKLAALAEHRTALACGNYLAGTEGLARHRALLLGAPRPGAAAEGYLCTLRPAQFKPAPP